MARLPPEQILRLHTATLATHLAGSRIALLGGVNTAFAASLPTGLNPSGQMLSDLHMLNAIERLDDGTVPLLTWLENAVALAGQRIEAGVFREAIEAIRRIKADELPEGVGVTHARGRGMAGKEDSLPMRREGPRAASPPAAPARMKNAIAEAKVTTSQTRRGAADTSSIDVMPRLPARASPPKAELTDQGKSTRHLTASSVSDPAQRSAGGKNIRLIQHTLNRLVGVWKDSQTGSTTYIRFCADGKLRSVYCYGGNHGPTGEYFDWKLIDGTALARYRWFQGAKSGYAYLRAQTEDRLDGGWRPSVTVDGDAELACDAELAEQLPKVSVAMTWLRQPASVVIPDWVEEAFQHLQRERKKPPPR